MTMLENNNHTYKEDDTTPNFTLEAIIITSSIEAHNGRDVVTIVLESTVSWLTIESNQLQPEYYFLPNTEPNPKYYLEKYFENRAE